MRWVSAARQKNSERRYTVTELVLKLTESYKAATSTPARAVISICSGGIFNPMLSRLSFGQNQTKIDPVASKVFHPNDPETKSLSPDIMAIVLSNSFGCLQKISNKYNITILAGAKMRTILPELPNYSYLLDYYREYSNPKDKIARETRKGNIIKLKQGVYVSRKALEGGLPKGLIANRLYGPSYVSFNSALRLYSLIPEDVPNLTSATLGKRRRKHFDTSLCTFFYRDVPALAYPRDVVYMMSGRWRFLAATPEKALCDELWTTPAIRSRSALRSLLFDDLRIDEEAFSNLAIEAIKSLAPLYSSMTLNTLLTMIGG